MTAEPDIKLGDVVTDRLTGFKGLVCASVEHLYGCREYGVQAKELQAGKPLPVQWFDFDRLEVYSSPTRKKARAAPVKRTTARRRVGGPGGTSVPPSRAHPQSDLEAEA